MKNCRQWTALLCAALLLAPVIAEEPAAPDFSLKDTDGKEHKLSDLKGKIVVLEWTNKGCPVVRKHYDPGHMQALAKKYMDKGVVWLAIDSTAGAKAADVKAWQGSAKISHPILMDPDGKVGHAYSASTTPHMFIVKDGQILYQGAIDDRSGKDSGNYVAKALDELLAGKAVSVKSSKPYGCSVKYGRS